MIRTRVRWKDGTLNTLIVDGDTYKLEGSRKVFNTLKELEDYYKGTIVSDGLKDEPIN